MIVVKKDRDRTLLIGGVPIVSVRHPDTKNPSCAQGDINPNTLPQIKIVACKGCGAPIVKGPRVDDFCASCMWA